MSHSLTTPVLHATSSKPLTASSSLVAASSDKTVSVWDARAALCVQTFYGHPNSCNSCSFNLAGTTVASTDADGSVKLWDVRMVAEIMTIHSGKFPANSCEFDRSGQVRGCGSSSVAGPSSDRAAGGALLVGLAREWRAVE